MLTAIKTDMKTKTHLIFFIPNSYFAHISFIIITLPGYECHSFMSKEEMNVAQLLYNSLFKMKTKKAAKFAA